MANSRTLKYHAVRFVDSDWTPLAAEIEVKGQALYNSEGTYSQTQCPDTGIRNQQHKQRIAQRPEQDQVRTESLVRVIQRHILIGRGLLVLRERATDGLLELGVDIGLRLVEFLDEVALCAVGALGLG